MKIRKLWIIMSLGCILIVSMTGCGNNSNGTNEKEDTQEMQSMATDEEAYCDFMEQYNDADTSDQANMMSEYTEYMQEYSDMLEKMDKIDEEGLSTADLAYYTEVTARVTKRLAEIQ